jgi:hypothetical protein
MHRAAYPLAVAAVALGAFAGARSAWATDAGPVIVIPGRLGMSVIINGVDVSGAILEGEFGLGKPHMVAPKIVAAPYWQPPPRGYLEQRYFPATGREPGYGRYEIEPPPNRQLPPRAPSFHRSWSSASDPTPASFDPPVPPPPILVEPNITRWPRHKKVGPTPKGP